MIPSYIHHAWSFWLTLGILFFGGEFLTATFYSLSVGVAAFLVSVLAYVLPSDDPTIFQAIVFLIVSTLLCVLLPRWMH